MIHIECIRYLNFRTQSLQRCATNKANISKINTKTSYDFVKINLANIFRYRQLGEVSNHWRKLNEIPLEQSGYSALQVSATLFPPDLAKSQPRRSIASLSVLEQSCLKIHAILEKVPFFLSKFCGFIRSQYRLVSLTER